jgi:lipopolysaccharide/colanic/teichoic acid biosynthesis glycosyltransferase
LLPGARRAFQPILGLEAEVAFRDSDRRHRNAAAAVLTADPRALAWPRSAVGAHSSRPITGPVYAVPVVPVAPANLGNQIAEWHYRIFEIALALIGLTVSPPVMTVVALCVRLDSPGPVLFMQQRTSRSRAVTGRNARDQSDLRAPTGGFQPDQLYYVPTFFRIVKFRTMWSDARERFSEIYAHQHEQDQFHSRRLKEEDNPRVTRLGHWLRRLTLDELPNLWCVLRGTMCLVGPRSEIPKVLKYYLPGEMYKFSARHHRIGPNQRLGQPQLGGAHGLGQGICAHAKRCPRFEDHCPDLVVYHHPSRGFLTDLRSRIRDSQQW